MVSITLSVPENMKHEMDTFQEINWSAVARQAIKRKLLMLDKFNEFTKDSSITEEEALKLGEQINDTVMKKHKARC